MTINNADMEERLLALSAKSEELETRLAPSMNTAQLNNLHRERDRLIKKINAASARSRGEERNIATVVESASKSAARKSPVLDGLEALIASFAMNRIKNVKILNARAANARTLNSKLANKKRAALREPYKQDILVIHLVPNPVISKPHGDLVVMRPDGTVLKKIGAYAKYGKAQYTTLKVDIVELKTYLQDGAIETTATKRLINDVINPDVRPAPLGIFDVPA